MAFTSQASAAEEASRSTRVLVYRTMMPEAGPSAFAVQLAEGIGLCYDPNRGGINYAWEGNIADLSPTTRAKINQPAELRGEIRYREGDQASLRLSMVRLPASMQFKGYRLLPDAVEFAYLLDGVPVREELRALPSGRGLMRHFRFESPIARCYVAVDAQSAATVSSPDGHWLEEAGVWEGVDRREFRVVITFKAKERP